MNEANEKSRLASAAMVAMEPLVCLLLEIGINCPESESLFRSIFVHTARDWLIQKRRETPSDVQIALVTGIHRNFVRDILKVPSGVAAIRRSRGLKVDRLVEGWRTDSMFVDDGGRPLALFRATPEPSLRSLIAKYIPGAPLAGTIGQLLRKGVVEILGDDRIQVCDTPRLSKRLSYAKVASMGEFGRELLKTLQHNLINPAEPLYYQRVRSVVVDSSQVPALRETIKARAAEFLSALEDEISTNSGKENRSPSKRQVAERVKVGLALLETENALRRRRADKPPVRKQRL